MTGHPTKARWLMEKAIQAGSRRAEDVAWCRAELANMLFLAGALLSADQQINLALDASPESHHVLAIAARIKAGREQFERAIELYKQSIARQPSHDALNALGDLHTLAGNTNEAAKQYEQLIALHAGDLHSHDGQPAHAHSHAEGNAQLARFYADHDRDLDLALAEAEHAFEKYKNVFTITTLAWCQYKKGLYPQARKTIQMALALRTPDPAILFRAGMIEAKLGHRANAQKLLYQALNLNPAFHPLEARAAREALASLAPQQTASR
jgi:tetratricopeptide (TPR) repeat protein